MFVLGKNTLFSFHLCLFMACVIYYYIFTHICVGVCDCEHTLRLEEIVRFSTVLSSALSL